MAKKRNSLVIIIGLLAIFVIIQACSLPIAKKTEAPAEVIVAPEEKTEEIFLPLVEGSEETEAEAETEAPAEEQPTNTPEPPTATPIPHVYLPGEPG